MIFSTENFKVAFLLILKISGTLHFFKKNDASETILGLCYEVGL
jgi:hypothetical protein